MNIDDLSCVMITLFIVLRISPFFFENELSFYR